jgi:hypothetical protein
VPAVVISIVSKPRYDAKLEALKRQFRFLLHRDLTTREELWLELSAPLLPFEEEIEAFPLAAKRAA